MASGNEAPVAEPAWHYGHVAYRFEQRGDALRLLYYRKGARGPGGYGRSASYIGADEGAPIVWEPEFSLGQLYNKNLFTLGYAPEVSYFCDCVLAGRRPAFANLDDTLAMMRWFEAYRQPAGQVIEIAQDGPP